MGDQVAVARGISILHVGPDGTNRTVNDDGAEEPMEPKTGVKQKGGKRKEATYASLTFINTCQQRLP